MSIESIIVPTATRFSATVASAVTSHPVGALAVGSVLIATTGYQAGKVAAPAFMAGVRLAKRATKRLTNRFKAAAASMAADTPTEDNVIPARRTASA